MKVNDAVAWTWGNGVTEGTIIAIRTERTEVESGGEKIVRNGTPDNPALIIKHASGNLVIKLQSEVQRTS